MNRKLFGIILIALGAIIALYGWNEYHSLGNTVASKLQSIGARFGGNGITENMKAFALMAFGVLTAIYGAYLAFIKR